MIEHVEALWACLAASNFFLLRVDSEPVWLPVPDRARFRRALGGAEKLASRSELSPLPRSSESTEAIGQCSCLWARVESGKQLDALTKFTPAPSIVLRDGDTLRRTALWALTGELDEQWAERLNRRIAHKLGTPKKYADPTRFTFTTPGAIGEGGKLVRVEHMIPEFYGAKEVAGRLQEAPDPHAWRNAQVAA